ncbi:MAG: ADP-glyceromanno-heptose 6-epimerase [Bdellovibrionota bacterium]
MKYLVTGAAGFIGSQFAASCNKLDIPVISVDKTSHFSSRPEHCYAEFGEIIDRDDLFCHLEDHKPKLAAIIHLGACTNTMETNRQYLKATNLEYSKNLWQYAAKNNIPFVYASSAATYGDGAKGYDDDEAMLTSLQPLNPYGESKHLFDLWVLEQERLKKTPPRWAAFKFFNVYGFGERHKGAMASVVLHAFDQIITGGKVHLFRSHRPDIQDGHQKRDFIHVDDTVSVLHFALNKPLGRGIFNLGTGHARSFLDLARAVFKELDIPENIEFIDTPADLRQRYQYFTKATMIRLRAAGYMFDFINLEDGVSRYVRQLKKTTSCCIPPHERKF